MCRECKKWTYEEVKKYIEVDSQTGTKLLSTTYENTKTKLLMSCGKCGAEFERSFDNFKNKKQYYCKQCAYELRHMPTKKDTKQFIKELEQVNVNIEVIGEYSCGHDKIKVKCKICNHTWETLPKDLLQGHGCPKCADSQLGKVKRKTHEDYVKEVHEINPNITIHSIYTKAHDRLDVKCNVCGHEWSPKAQSLYYYGCPICANEEKKNPNLTDEDRQRDRSLMLGYKKWTGTIKTLFNNTCDCCGYKGDRMVAHHLNDYHSHKELATDIDNGVCLCEHCHKEFHSWMGGTQVSCTKQDYMDFKEIKQNEKEQDLVTSVA